MSAEKAKNTSGIYPVEYKVLIKPDQVDEKTTGGIYVPKTVQAKERFAKDEGVVIAIGAIAFTDPDWGLAPGIGDRVLYDKYAGSLVKGKDGEEYRLINDKEIGAILE